MRTLSRTFALVLGMAVACLPAMNTHAQLVSSWSAPSFDDGVSVAPLVRSWLTDVSSGDFLDLLQPAAAQALAADNANGILYSSTGRSLSSFEVNENGEFVQREGSPQIVDSRGVPAESDQVLALGFARGVLFASVGRKLGDEQRNRGIRRGLYMIDPETAIATLILSENDFPIVSGIDYNPIDGLMYAVTGATNEQTIIAFDLATFTVTPVTDVPVSAYGGVPVSRPFDGVAVGDGFVYLTSGSDDVPIVVYDLATDTFGESLLNPPRTAENGFYAGGATFFPALIGADAHPGPPASPKDLNVRNRNSNPQYNEVQLSWSSRAEPDVVSYNIFRSLDGDEFAQIASTETTRFFDDEIDPGTTYFYYVTAVDVGGLESEPSNTVEITTSGDPQSAMFVSEIRPSIRTNNKGRNRARVGVTVVDEDGNPVEGASVTVTFTGTFSETLTKQTNRKGRVSITTDGRTTDQVTFEACVVNVVAEGSVYDPEQNVETCDGV